MVKRGVSLQEKKDRLKKILTDGKCPYTLKELEKLGAKKGVNAMAIKGVLQEMVDDNIIVLDKIGSSNYYWCFPAEALSKAQNQVAQLEKESQSVEKEIKETEEAIKKAQESRGESAERTAKLNELNELKAEHKKLEAEVAKFAEFEKQEKLVKALEICKQASFRWTDNTWALCDYLRKKFGVTKQMAEQQLQMKDDFDYPEYVQPKKKIKR